MRALTPGRGGHRIARVQRLAAKRPAIAIEVEVIRRETVDPTTHRRLVMLLAALLDGRSHSGGG